VDAEHEYAKSGVLAAEGIVRVEQCSDSEDRSNETSSDTARSTIKWYKCWPTLMRTLVPTMIAE
jgi:hypothetical protein